MAEIKKQSGASHSEPSPKKRLYYPAVVISDAHLGKKYCQPDMLFEFLDNIECDMLFLNGDIIDGWALEGRKQKAFPEMQRRVLDAINSKRANGTKVVYIPGNHDARLRRKSIIGKSFTDIPIEDAVRYTDPAGRSWYILHGDQFDPNMLKLKKGEIICRVGSTLYDGMVAMSITASRASQVLTKERFSAAAYLKEKTKNLMSLIGNFEESALQTARLHEVDGVFCGHIHTAAWREMDHPDAVGRDGRKLLYGNSGDWVESCTALTMDEHGDWQVLNWFDKRRELGLQQAPNESDPNPYQDARAVTNIQIRAINQLWPGRNRKKKLQKFIAAGEELTALKQELTPTSPSPQNERKSVGQTHIVERMSKLENKRAKWQRQLWP